MTSLLDRFDDFIIFTRRLSEKTREVYSMDARLYLEYLDESGIRLEDAGVEEIESYLIWRRRCCAAWISGL